MKKILKWSPFCLVIMLLSGCGSTITNLTPSKQFRTASGMYPVEVAWDSHDQTVRNQTLTPYVVLDSETIYKMRPTYGMRNRWETVIPVPPGKTLVPYHIKFDYEYNKFGKPAKNSKLSSGYKLEIIEK